MRAVRTLAPVLALAIGSLVVADIAAAASCADLWYERNSIYAEAGHCFKTQRGIAAFGRGCFAPYGKLNGGQQARVNAILVQEGRLGCN